MDIITNNKIKLIECPRDAMQGWGRIISTQDKIRYISALLKVGFDTVDFGSFVSAKMVPQMEDTKLVLEGLIKNKILLHSKTKLLAIVANVRGAEEAITFDEISCIGYPFSISSTFQYKNANSTIYQSFERLEEIYNLCIKSNKQLVVYLSMGFGNPYGDVFNLEIVTDWIKKISALGVEIISVADTVGVADSQLVAAVLGSVVQQFPEIEVGTHLHAQPLEWEEKISAAYHAGCTRFDGTLKGIGGCPFAKDELIGNINTENIISFLEKEGNVLSLNKDYLQESIKIAEAIFI